MDSEKMLPPGTAYDLWAASYDEDPNPMVALSTRVLGALSPIPRAVLELGCGTGRNLIQLHALGVSDLSGVDLSQGMLDAAKEKLPAAKLWLQDGASQTPLPEESVDLVLIVLVLEHIEDPTPLFNEAFRVLEPGGRALILELHPKAFEVGSRAHFKDQDGQRYFTAAYPHTQAQLNACAQAAGLNAGRFEDLCPPKDLEERFPSRRASGSPWLLMGSWRKQEMSSKG